MRDFVFFETVTMRNNEVWYTSKHYFDRENIIAVRDESIGNEYPLCSLILSNGHSYSVKQHAQDVIRLLQPFNGGE